ncbi:hypothetical protein DIPPA_22410 [Diplonema papillatum]|nr:hypothetical protein DIPPA_22410 [Diplonema papillatum]
MAGQPKEVNNPFTHVFSKTKKVCGRGSGHEAQPLFELGCGHCLCQNCVLISGKECPACGWQSHPAIHSMFSNYCTTVRAPAEALRVYCPKPCNGLFNAFGFYLGASLTVEMCFLFLNKVFSEPTAEQAVISVFSSVGDVVPDQFVDCIVQSIHHKSLRISEQLAFPTATAKPIGSLPDLIERLRSAQSRSSAGLQAYSAIVLSKHATNISLLLDVPSASSSPKCHVFDPYGIGRERLPYIASFASDCDALAFLARRLQNGANPDLTDCPEDAPLHAYLIESVPPVAASSCVGVSKKHVEEAAPADAKHDAEPAQTVEGSSSLGPRQAARRRVAQSPPVPQPKPRAEDATPAPASGVAAAAARPRPPLSPPNTKQAHAAATPPPPAAARGKAGGHPSPQPPPSASAAPPKDGRSSQYFDMLVAAGRDGTAISSSAAAKPGPAPPHRQLQQQQPQQYSPAAPAAGVPPGLRDRGAPVEFSALPEKVAHAILLLRAVADQKPLPQRASARFDDSSAPEDYPSALPLYPEEAYPPARGDGCLQNACGDEASHAFSNGGYLLQQLNRGNHAAPQPGGRPPQLCVGPEPARAAAASLLFPGVALRGDVGRDLFAAYVERRAALETSELGARLQLADWERCARGTISCDSFLKCGREYESSRSRGSSAKSDFLRMLDGEAPHPFGTAGQDRRPTPDLPGDVSTASNWNRQPSNPLANFSVHVDGGFTERSRTPPHRAQSDSIPERSAFERIVPVSSMQKDAAVPLADKTNRSTLYANAPPNSLTSYRMRKSSVANIWQRLNDVQVSKRAVDPPAAKQPPGAACPAEADARQRAEYVAAKLNFSLSSTVSLHPTPSLIPQYPPDARQQQQRSSPGRRASHGGQPDPSLSIIPTLSPRSISPMHYDSTGNVISLQNSERRALEQMEAHSRKALSDWERIKYSIALSRGS